MISLGTLGKDQDSLTRSIRILAEYQETIPLDAAPRYGNLAAVGAAIRKSGLRRDSLVVTTKINRRRQEELGAIESLKNDLEQLGLDYVDHYLIHSASYPCYGKTWDKMQVAVKCGLAKSIGVSSFKSEQIASLGGEMPTVIQVPPLKDYAYPEYLNQYSLQGMQIEGYSFIRKVAENGEIASALETVARGLEVEPMVLINSWCSAVNMVLILGTKSHERLRKFAELPSIAISREAFDATTKVILA